MKYYIITYGCQMNQSDSERVAGMLEKIGFKPVKIPEQADLIIVNLCSVRQAAIDRAVSKIKNFAKLKVPPSPARGGLRRASQNPKLKVVLTGCILNRDKRQLKELCDGIFGIDKLNELPAMLKKLGFKINKTPGQKTNHYLQIAPEYQSGIVAYIPIMTGCNNFCSYCVVPYLRGQEISRPAEEIICEVKNATKNGAKEIWLLGQNVNSYRPNFAKLLTRINALPGEFWIRFTSSHPKDLSPEMIETFAKCQKATPYINLPIQAGDDEILKKMNRPYTIKHYKNLVKKLKMAFQKNRTGLEKKIALSTDVIVGFPNETKKQFENTKRTFKEIGFATAYLSRYSPRPQTAAFRLKNNVSNKDKKQREKELAAIVAKTALQFNKQFLNKVVNVLVLEKKNGFFLAKTMHYQTLRLAPPFDKTQGGLAQDKLLQLAQGEYSKGGLIGKFMTVKVTKAMPYGLEGKIVKN